MKKVERSEADETCEMRTKTDIRIDANKIVNITSDYTN